MYILRHAYGDYRWFTVHLLQGTKPVPKAFAATFLLAIRSSLDCVAAPEGALAVAVLAKLWTQPQPSIWQ